MLCNTQHHYSNCTHTEYRFVVCCVVGSGIFHELCIATGKESFPFLFYNSQLSVILTA